MRTKIMGLVVLAGLVSWPGAGTDRAWGQQDAAADAGKKEVFVDHFKNGKPADSDGIEGFWHFDAKAAPSIREADGALTLTAGGESKIASVWMRSALSDDFNFFKRRLKFEVSVQMSGTATSDAKMMRFVLTSDPAKMNYISPDALSVCYEGHGNLQLAWKLNTPNKTPEDPTMGHRLVSVKLSEPLRKFDLELDATTYTLVVYYGTESQTFTGTHGIDPAQWGANTKGIAPVTHDSAIELETLRVNAPDVSTQTVTTWKSIVVTKAPEPANP
ncbi:MAG: hypothetical protein ACYC26_16860 [Phycisphaerales bacterium]